MVPAKLNYATGEAVDTAGNLFIADTFYVAKDLPHNIHYGLQYKLQRDAGLGTLENGRWIPPNYSNFDEDGRKRQQAEEYRKFDAIVSKMEEVAGRYSYMTNPETGKIG